MSMRYGVAFVEGRLDLHEEPKHNEENVCCKTVMGACQHLLALRPFPGRWFHPPRFCPDSVPTCSEKGAELRHK